MDYKLAVFIGRFQPVHNSHLQVIRQGLAIAEKVLIVVGSAYTSPNIKNPFSVTDRINMIKCGLNKEEGARVSFEVVRDYFYNENTWITDIQRVTSNHYKVGDTVALIGSYKDASSYYLKYFPQFEFVGAKNTEPLNSTDVRRWLFDKSNFEDAGFDEYSIVRKLNIVKPPVGIPDGVLWYLSKEFIGTPGHHSLISEYEFIEKYKAAWAEAPFPVTFVTTDAVVIQSGHILLVKRKFNPGKGLYALPGGFIRPNETIESAAIRELKEETGIRVHKELLKSKIKDSRVFDHPERSLRGRTVTHAYFIKLDGGELPEVKGNDDADGAMWIPLMDLGRLESSFYEDHFHIIQHFINRS